AADASHAPAPIKLIRKIPYWVANGAEMAKLFLMPAIDSSKYQPTVR
ncbi:MAG: magnesium-protoporphyrin IX monomethyl ester cyclase, partial [Synechococcus sp. cluster2_bin.44]|nr:magnesium-protoporphyrin IX monomethyl ester cyclase [Synechococcus sp. cluster2_bin.44]